MITQFGRLTVLEIMQTPLVKCLCSCGTEVVVNKYRLNSGKTKSCGCLRKETTAKQATKHGKSKHKLYYVHNSMMSRCYNKKTKQYKNYGERGITVCKEWHDKLKFIRWAEKNGWKENLTINRKDNDSSYSPENCEFIPLADQANNKTDSVKFSYKGETKTIAQWAKALGMKYGTIYHRFQQGWPPEKIVEGRLHKGGFHYHKQKG